MILMIDLITFMIGLLFACISMKKILTGKYNILYVAIIVFFIIQIVPIVVGFFGNLNYIKKYYPYMYYAMTDYKVSILYDLFCIATIVILYLFSKKMKIQKKRLADLKFEIKKNYSFLVIILFSFTIISYIFAVLFAPDPTVYLKFSYFYTHPYNEFGNIYLYHTSVMRFIGYINFFSILLSYFLSKSNNKVLYSIPIFLLAWINGKRTLFLFLLIGILVIDFFKADKSNKTKIKKIIKKAILFLTITIIYYVIYNKLTSKADFADKYLLYSTYFSRLSNVKVAIYDKLYTNSMIEYPFQNIFYDLLFFLPRNLWPSKPYGYYPYFTSYVFYGVGNMKVSHMAFQVNIWSEYISNGGIIGWLLSMIIVIVIAKKVESSKNTIVLLSGTIFILLFMVYGFEHIVQITYILFIASNVLEYMKNHVKL